MAQIIHSPSQPSMHSFSFASCNNCKQVFLDHASFYTAFSISHAVFNISAIALGVPFTRNLTRYVLPSLHMSRHCSSYGAYLSSPHLSHTHCIKTPSTTASVDCDQASQIDGSAFQNFCGFHSYNTTVKVLHCISQMILLHFILLAWEIGPN